jgi:DNA-binding SARP family transcriptional activator/predicted ATPase
MPLTLQVKLLGEWSMTYDDRAVVEINTARSQALLAYLILYRHAPQPRQRLAFHLWADSTETQARTNLRKELSYLRRNLPQADQFLLVESKTLQWSPTAPFVTDLVEFENALVAAEASDGKTAQSWLKQAIALYKGELLPGCEDEWILPERERLQQRYTHALEQLVDNLEAQQDYRAALGYAQQLLRVDGLNEATYCTLMRLYQGSGDRANALQVYHRCMTVLREELGVDPSVTTRKLYKQLLHEDEPSTAEVPAHAIRLHLSASPRPASLKSSVSSLVGRKHEWDLIQEWVSTDSYDDSQLLLLIGEPGIGKTRLLEELRDTVSLAKPPLRRIALWGRAFAAELLRPYGIWIDALRSLELPPTVTLPLELGFLLPEIGQPVSAPPDRSHLFDAVVQLLAEWSSQTPLIVMLDDIQWLDEASSALLNYATRLLRHLPVKFACTARSGELSQRTAISQVLQLLRREQRLKSIELQAFDRGNTAELIRTVKADKASNLSVETVDQVFTDSGGNPLFVMEIARALSQNQSTRADYADNLEALICDRLEKLEDAARDFLPWAAAFGRSFNPTTVAQVVDLPLPQMLTAIEQLEQQAIIRPSTLSGNEIGYDFAHDIVRQVVYHQISQPRRQLVHLQIAHKLNQSSTSDRALSGDVAHHAALGGDHELAASAALIAAERCLKLFAYTEAAALAERGGQHCRSLDPQTQIWLQLGLLRVWALAGVTTDRATQLEVEIQQCMAQANRLGLKEAEAIGLEALTILHFNQNKFADFHQHSLQAAEISCKASPATAARLLAFSASCLFEVGQDMERAEALLLEAQSLAARVDLQIADLYAGLAAVYYHKGCYAKARTTMEQAWNQSQAEQDHWRECIHASYLAMLELEVGDPAAALPYCKAMASVAAKIQGEGSEGAIAAALKALANYKLQKTGAEIELQQAIATLRQIDAKRMLSYVLNVAAEADLVSQRLELTVVRAEAGLEVAQIKNHASETASAWAILIHSLVGLGDLERATAQFEALHHQIDRRQLSAHAQGWFDRTLQLMQNR